METIRVFADEFGRHLLKMPNGDIIPAPGKTIVKQEVDQALVGRCTVIVVFENVILEPNG